VVVFINLKGDGNSIFLAVFGVTPDTVSNTVASGGYVRIFRHKTFINIYGFVAVFNNTSAFKSKYIIVVDKGKLVSMGVGILLGGICSIGDLWTDI
jgi:hypothetical protein